MLQKVEKKTKKKSQFYASGEILIVNEQMLEKRMKILSKITTKGNAKCQISISFGLAG